ncbi:MAG: hypothetical protein BWY63_01041 [Chloroflexi bacterium ADurb.Bin360]|nr:MAG: hypothetical protein BWY63_01041 [Chloroflexi bacterium ADurb.Bin360]
MINEDAITTIGEIERDVLVGKLAACAAILVPHIHRLPVLHQRREALA